MHNAAVMACPPFLTSFSFGVSVAFIILGMCLDNAILYPRTQTTFTRLIERVIRLSERLETGKRSMHAQNARCFFPDSVEILTSLTYLPSIQEWGMTTKNCLEFQVRLPVLKQTRPLPCFWSQRVIRPKADAL